MPTILAIDDINDNLISLKAVIKETFPDSTVITALNGPKGIELAIANNPDVIFLDIIMPGMDGFEVCRQLKQDERVSDIPVVFLTALKGDKENRIKAIEAGAEGFLSKPIDETELIVQTRAMIKIRVANNLKRDEKEMLQILVEERTRELVKREAQLKGIFDNLQDAYIQADLSGNFTLVSPSAFKMYGYDSINELIGQPANMLYYNPQDRESILALLHSRGRVEDCVGQGRKKDGTAFWVSMNAQLMYGADGQIIGTEGVVRDITERKKSEEALQEMSDIHADMIANIGDVIGIIGIDEITKYKSPNIETYFGWNATDLIGKDAWAFVHPDDKERIRKAFFDLVKIDRASSSIEFRYKCKNGSYKWVELNAVNRISSPHINGLLINYHDITERKNSEQSIHESEERFRMVFENVFDGLSIFEEDPDPYKRKLIDCNERYANMAGRTRQELLNLENPLPLQIALDTSTNELRLDSLIKKTAYQGSFSWIRPDGKNNIIEYIGVPVMWNGKSYSIGIDRDVTERKNAEERLKDSNDLNTSLLQSIPFAIDIVDENGIILFQSENLKRLFGSNTIGHKCWEIYREDKCQCAECPLLSGIESGKTEMYESHGVLGGRIFEISHTGMIFKGKKAMLEIFMDITERKLTEELIRKNNLTLELAMQSANMAWWEMEMATGLVTFEKRKAEMLGYSPDQFKHYTDFMALVHPDDYDRNMDAMRSHLSGTTSKYEVEYRIKAKSGDYKWFYDIGSVIQKDDSGKPMTLAGLVLNITDRKKAELELLDAKEKAEKSEQQLLISNRELTERNKFIQTILDNLPIGVALNSIDAGVATYMNKKFEEIYGWNSAEITSIGSFFEHVYPDANYRNQLMGQIMDDIQSGDLERMQWENIFVTRKDGNIRVVNAVNIPLVEQNTMVSTVSDITDLHKTQHDLLAAKQKAEESDRLKSAFLANMSHEIRTPLNSIIGFSELMTDPDFDESQNLEFAKLIHSSGNYLLSIISDIMDLSKIEAGQINLFKNEFSVIQLISDIQKQYAYSAAEKGLELNEFTDNGVSEIILKSDQNRIRQVLVNFVSNAIKFTLNGQVELGVKILEKDVLFYVKDSGIGIPKEFHDRIFERFRQIESSDSRRYGGNGLGLAISKSLVELLGGRIWLESQSNVGSTFYFTVPR
jgi:PAS domain S-box-containing protein